MHLIELPSHPARRKRPLDQLVITTRIRIARNLDGMKFPLALTDTEKNNIDKQLIELVRTLEPGTQVDSVDSMEREKLMIYLANHVITNEFIQRGRHVLYSPAGDWVMMLQEDDHIRLFSIESGYSVQGPYERLSKLAARMEEKVDFAFDDQYGYLTSSILNVGCGLRLTFLVNLFGLVSGKKIEPFIDTANKMGFSVIHYGGNTDSSLFFIYPIYSLGLSENDLLKDCEAFLEKTWQAELEARQTFFANRDELELAYEELFELQILENMSEEAMHYYVTLLDAMHGTHLTLNNREALRGLIFSAADDSLLFRSHVDREELNHARLNLFRQSVMPIQYHHKPKTLTR